jgi:hypothetical protein
MMPAAAALAINQAQLCNECNKIAQSFKPGRGFCEIN